MRYLRVDKPKGASLGYRKLSLQLGVQIQGLQFICWWTSPGEKKTIAPQLARILLAFWCLKVKAFFCLLLRWYKRLLALFPALISFSLLCPLLFSHHPSPFLPFLLFFPSPFLYHLNISVDVAELSDFPYSCGLGGWNISQGASRGLHKEAKRTHPLKRQEIILTDADAPVWQGFITPNELGNSGKLTSSHI